MPTVRQSLCQLNNSRPLQSMPPVLKLALPSPLCRSSPQRHRLLHLKLQRPLVRVPKPQLPLSSNDHVPTLPPALPLPQQTDLPHAPPPFRFLLFRLFLRLTLRMLSLCKLKSRSMVT
jgi:hypothetical protein